MFRIIYRAQYVYSVCTIMIQYWTWWCGICTHFLTPIKIIWFYLVQTRKCPSSPLASRVIFALRLARCLPHRVLREMRETCHYRTSHKMANIVKLQRRVRVSQRDPEQRCVVPSHQVGGGQLASRIQRII